MAADPEDVQFAVDRQVELDAMTFEHEYESQRATMNMTPLETVTGERIIGRLLRDEALPSVFAAHPSGTKWVQLPAGSKVAPLADIEALAAAGVSLSLALSQYAPPA